MTIGPATTLREIAFIVCTAFDRAGTRAVLSGGGAATVYAEDAYQSHDLDFIFEFWSTTDVPSAQPILELGFEARGQMYAHPESLFTLEFPPGPLMIGHEIITKWDTHSEGDQTLFILNPTDCVRDRLVSLIHWNDFSALEQALSVATRHKVDLDLIKRWCVSEGGSRQFQVFFDRLKAHEESP